MTRIGPTKPASPDFAKGRLQQARDYLQAAEVDLELVESNSNPAISQMINALIAYTDALCAGKGGHVNQKDHQQAPKLLRATLGNKLPAKQEKTLKRLLKQKDTVQYGARIKSKAEALLLLEDTQDFARWAELEFTR